MGSNVYKVCDTWPDNLPHAIVAKPNGFGSDVNIPSFSCKKSCYFCLQRNQRLPTGLSAHIAFRADRARSGEGCGVCWTFSSFKASFLYKQEVFLDLVGNSFRKGTYFGRRECIYCAFAAIGLDNRLWRERAMMGEYAAADYESSEEETVSVEPEPSPPSAPVAMAPFSKAAAATPSAALTHAGTDAVSAGEGGARSAPAKRPRRERSSSAELVGVGPGRSAGPARTHARPVEVPLDEVAKKKEKEAPR